MTIKTETNHADTDLAEVIVILHKQLELGYVSAYQAIALAELVTKARGDATAPFPRKREETPPIDRCGAFLCQNAMAPGSLRCSEHALEGK